MELNVKQRLMLLNVVPVEGVRMTDLRIAQELRLKLGFSEEDQKHFGFWYDDEKRLRWKPEADVPVDIKIGPRAQVLIVDTLKQLDEDKKLTEDHIDIWELFECDKE